MGHRAKLDFDVDTYSCDHVLGDVFSFLPTLIFTTFHHKFTYSRGEGSIPRSRQSMFDNTWAELDKTLCLKLSDPAGGVEVRTTRGSFKSITGSRSIYEQNK